MKTLDQIIEDLERWHDVRARLNSNKDQYKQMQMDTLLIAITHLKEYKNHIESCNSNACKRSSPNVAASFD